VVLVHVLRPVQEPRLNPNEATRRIVKRYSNRKLYDTKDSRYVTLLQIGELVRSGEEVHVIDNNSKEDLTEVTLAQIIYEEQKANQRNVPIQTLRNLIHQRTETVLTSLREGPIGRLIPSKLGGKDDDGEQTEEAREEARANAKPSLVEQARGTFEDLQHKIDERIKAVLPSILPWQQLEREVVRLTARVDELEARLPK
jgi:polyhydroxyalkanoate synthesis repressor PhaR